MANFTYDIVASGVTVQVFKDGVFWREAPFDDDHEAWNFAEAWVERLNKGDIDG